MTAPSVRDMDLLEAVPDAADAGFSPLTPCGLSAAVGPRSRQAVAFQSPATAVAGGARLTCAACLPPNMERITSKRAAART